MKSQATRHNFFGLSSDFAAAMLRNGMLLLLGLLLSFQVFAWGTSRELSRENLSQNVISVSQLPQEAQTTLMLIKQGGPFPYAKDGVTFGNYEGMLPKQRRGYYHEFTVKTPYARNRGARRIIAGGNPQTSGEYYYTDNHYQTFRRIQE